MEDNVKQEIVETLLGSGTVLVDILGMTLAAAEDLLDPWEIETTRDAILMWRRIEINARELVPLMVDR